MELQTRLTLGSDLMLSPNLCERILEADLNAIGYWCWQGYDRDEQSRASWKMRMQAALGLAMQVSGTKNFPWPNCSNVAFPLVTIAALQFHAQAYPAILSGPDIVKYRVIGPDPQGTERARGQRIGCHMSYQLIEEDPGWEEGIDRALLQLPILGCVFKKTYFSADKRHNISELVAPHDLVLDYYARSVEDCTRKTHVIPLYRNEVYERVKSGVFRDILSEGWYTSAARPPTTPSSAARDQRTGANPPPVNDDATPFRFLEQHCLIDFDGDGYAEPYVVTIEETSKCVVRVVARWDREVDVERNPAGEVVRIRSTEYFTKYSFIPSPDGGVYDIGFGVLLGPLNESVNAIINQMVDAGTLANTAGGFLGRGAKIRGGAYTFSPFQWSRVDSSGEDLHKNIFPLPVREPSAVLFQLLSLLINYTQRISGSTDTMTGENPGQNTPAHNMDTMVEQGMKIYKGLFKRVWRGLKEEFKKLYILNAINLESVTYYAGQDKFALKKDYQGDPDRIVPVADPNIASDTARIRQALALKQAAMSTPGYSLPAVEMRYLAALQIEDVAEVYPGPDKVPPLPNPKMQLEQMKLQAKETEWQHKMQQFALGLMEDRRVNDAKILELEMKAEKHKAEAAGVSDGHHIAAFEAALGALKTHNDHLNKQIEHALKSMEIRNDQQASNGGGVPGMAASPGHAGALPSPAPQAGSLEGAMG